MAASDFLSHHQMRDIIESHGELTGVELFHNGDMTLPNGMRIPAISHTMNVFGPNRQYSGLLSRAVNEKGADISVRSTSHAPTSSNRPNRTVVVYSRTSPDYELLVANNRELAPRGDQDIKDFLNREPVQKIPGFGPDQMKEMASRRHLLTVKNQQEEGGPFTTKSFNLRTGYFED